MPGSKAGWSTLALFAWVSPAFPVGAYTYSHGLETAVDEGLVEGLVGLQAWLTDLIDHGAIRNDAILVAATWRAGRDKDVAAFTEANDLALALCPSRERRLEAVGQGNAFATAIRAAWPDAAFAWPEGDLAYPAAFGSACAVAEIDLQSSLEAFGLAFIQNLVSAAIRLGVVGQTDGQRVTAGLVPQVHRLAAMSAGSALDDLGGCAQRSDIMALRHETLYSRLFRS
ncbi:urease accessory protein UreF [Lichenifustis flavocetrariae]|uniref:Urease accessory protein UreF n=1 Tax=Lichenifustis flavocetrariae TaxID=2949735 RepID=A0AA41YV75_9HYPH|nr:urease accessory protein UreF [Lichenifustis flavocetrariae]MCW6507702.1 urease accessory protein UreF [Lichenifustis flavocetrariae]